MGYEGPVSIGGFAGSLAVIVCSVLCTWLLARWLIGRFSGR